MSNFFKQLQALLAPDRMEIGTVIAVNDGIAVLELPGGGRTRARGQATVGGKVFVQGGVIQGPAPSLPVVVDVI